MYARTDQAFATAYYHWFFLIQPFDLPERLIGADPDYYLAKKLGGWGSGGLTLFDPRAYECYRRAFANPATIHASCEDYRAAVTVDLEHDRADAGRLLEPPVLVLYGGRGFVGGHYDVDAVWRGYAADVRTEAVDCGHFLPEEAPDATLAALRRFLG